MLLGKVVGYDGDDNAREGRLSRCSVHSLVVIGDRSLTKLETVA